MANNNPFKNQQIETRIKASLKTVNIAALHISSNQQPKINGPLSDNRLTHLFTSNRLCVEQKTF